MPSTNYFKFGASGKLSVTRGGFKVGAAGGADYGPTSSTGFWNGVTPPVGGYTIYVNKASQGPSIHVANNDSQCIFKLKAMGATGSTIENVLAWANGQSNILVMTSELTVGDITPPTYTIGQAALGGKIAYINGGGLSGTSGFVVYHSSTPFSTGGGSGTYVTTAREIGTGQSNTAAIVAAGGSVSGTPVYFADTLNVNGYSDWYLPSWDELRQIYINRGSLSPMATNVTYYSSTDYSASHWRGINFAFGSDSLVGKGFSGGAVVAIRSF